MVDKGLKVLYLPHALLSKYGGISARISPTCNLTNLYNYSQRSACVGFPCNGLAQSLDLHYRYDAPVTLIPSMHRISSFKKGEQKLIRLEYSLCIAYWMNENQVTKDFLLIQCLPFFINLIESEKRYKPKGEISTSV